MAEPFETTPELPQLSVHLNESADLNQSFDSHRRELDQCLAQLIKEGITNKDVHQYRIDVRRMRAILWLTRDGRWQSDSGQINRVLRNSFKVFEYPRKLAVFLKTLKKIPVHKKILKTLEKEIMKNRVGMTKDLKKHRRKIKVTLSPSLNVTTNLTEGKLELYANLLKEADVHDMEAIHGLRIYGKKVMYLIEEGILTCDCTQDLQMIKDLHTLIGKLNDVAENRKLSHELALTERYKKLSDYEDALEIYFTERENELKEKIQNQIFTMALRWQNRHLLP